MINIGVGMEQKSRTMYNKKKLKKEKRSPTTNRNAKYLKTKLKMITKRNKRTAYRMRVLKKENKTLKSKLEIFEKAMNSSGTLMEEKVKLLELLVEEKNMWVKSLTYSIQTFANQHMKLRLENAERKRNEQALKNKIKHLQFAIAQNVGKPNIKVSVDTANWREKMSKELFDVSCLKMDSTKKPNFERRAQRRMNKLQKSVHVRQIFIANPQMTVLQNREGAATMASCEDKRDGKSYVTGKEKFSDPKSSKESSVSLWKDVDTMSRNSLNNNNGALWGCALFPFKVGGGKDWGISEFTTKPSE